MYLATQRGSHDSHAHMRTARIGPTLPQASEGATTRHTASTAHTPCERAQHTNGGQRPQLAVQARYPDTNDNGEHEEQLNSPLGRHGGHRICH